MESDCCGWLAFRAADVGDEKYIKSRFTADMVAFGLNERLICMSTAMALITIQHCITTACALPPLLP